MHSRGDAEPDPMPRRYLRYSAHRFLAAAREETQLPLHAVGRKADIRRLDLEGFGTADLALEI